MARASLRYAKSGHLDLYDRGMVDDEGVVYNTNLPDYCSPTHPSAIGFVDGNGNVYDRAVNPRSIDIIGTVDMSAGYVYKTVRGGGMDRVSVGRIGSNGGVWEKSGSYCVGYVDPIDDYRGAGAILLLLRDPTDEDGTTYGMDETGYADDVGGGGSPKDIIPVSGIIIGLILFFVIKSWLFLLGSAVALAWVVLSHLRKGHRLDFSCLTGKLLLSAVGTGLISYVAGIVITLLFRGIGRKFNTVMDEAAVPLILGSILIGVAVALDGLFVDRQGSGSASPSGRAIFRAKAAPKAKAVPKARTAAARPAVGRLISYQGRDHLLVACPHCRAKSRLPRHKGLLSVTCPNCRGKFTFKTGKAK